MANPQPQPKPRLTFVWPNLQTGGTMAVSLGWLCALFLLFLAVLLAIIGQLTPVLAGMFVLAALSRLIP